MTVSSDDIEREVRNLRVSNADLRAEAVEVSLEKPTSTTMKTTVAIESNGGEATGGCPYGGEGATGGCPHRFIPLRMGGNGGTHKPSSATKKLLETEVTFQDIKGMTEQFYKFAFQDETLDKFIHSHSDPHGSRFAKWIHQKLTGSQLWDHDRANRDLTPRAVAGGQTAVVHDRTSAHVAAWYSSKRPRREVGRHFTLEECRVWMRLHFWAMRESGLADKSPTFADYYVRFIGHFVAVYERTATQFARESFRWSSNPKNIEEYIQNGRKMKDVLGLKYRQALRHLPESELDDDWPYMQEDRQ